MHWPIFAIIILTTNSPLSLASDCPSCKSEAPAVISNSTSSLVLDSFCTEEAANYDPDEFTEPEQGRIEAAIEEYFRKHPGKDKFRCDIRLEQVVRRDYKPHENAAQVELALQMKPVLYVKFKEFGERKPYTPPPTGEGESFVHVAAIERALKAHIFSQRSRGLKAGVVLYADCLKSVGINAERMATGYQKRYGLSQTEIKVLPNHPDGICNDYYDHPDNEALREELKNTVLPKGYQYTPFRVECPSVVEKEVAADKTKASKTIGKDRPYKMRQWRVIKPQKRARGKARNANCPKFKR